MSRIGITCSCSEMSAKGKSGIRIDLDKVPLREPDMNPYPNTKFSVPELFCKINVCVSSILVLLKDTLELVATF